VGKELLFGSNKARWNKIPIERSFHYLIMTPLGCPPKVRRSGS